MRLVDAPTRGVERRRSSSSDNELGVPVAGGAIGVPVAGGAIDVPLVTFSVWGPGYQAAEDRQVGG